MQTAANLSFGACAYCGTFHVGTCWRVKRMEYYPDGTLKAVELHEPLRADAVSTVQLPKPLPDATATTSGAAHA